jgi:cytidylate kinase
MTVTALRTAGVVVDDGVVNRWQVSPGPVRLPDQVIEPDLSNAAPFLAAAMVTGGHVRVAAWPEVTTQAGDALRSLFVAMGGRATFGAGGLSLQGPDRILGLEADLHAVGELAPVLAAVCAVATTPSILRGIAHLRLHETDRLAALARELSRLGAKVDELPDGLHIDPAPLHGATFRTYDDHRLATAAAVLGLVVPGVRVENVETTAKTLPGFVERWRNLLEGRSVTGKARALRVIAIDGPAGSGKSTVARALARRLGLDYLDTGAMYRAVAFAALARGVAPEDIDAVADIARSSVIEVDERGVRVDGVDVAVEIRGPEVTRAVGPVAANPAVRAELREQQREWAYRRGGGVMEGRDIGTVVFPDAVLKVYLTAHPEVRATRRAQEVTDLDYHTVAADIARRDALDQNRTHDPLTEAADAIVIDTSHLSIDQVVAKLAELVP